MKLFTAIAFSALIAVPMLSSVAYANDYDDIIEQQVYSDVNFDQNTQKAVRDLQKRGYVVQEIDVDTYRGKPVLEVEAYKNGQKYEIIMEYPSLRILKEKRDY